MKDLNMTDQVNSQQKWILRTYQEALEKAKMKEKAAEEEVPELRLEFLPLPRPSEMAKLRKANQSLRKEVANLTKELEAAHEWIEAGERDVQRIAEELRKAKEMISNAEEREERAQKRAKTAEKSIVKLIKEAMEAEANGEAAANELAEAKKSLAESKRVQEAMRNEICDLNQEAEWRRDLRDFEESVREQQQETESCQSCAVKRSANGVIKTERIKKEPAEDDYHRSVNYLKVEIKKEMFP